jgi:hypothetical protein
MHLNTLINNNIWVNADSSSLVFSQYDKVSITQFFSQRAAPKELKNHRQTTHDDAPSLPDD